MEVLKKAIVYLFVIALLALLPVVLRDPRWLHIVIMIYLYIMRVEEPELRERFGSPYEDYLKRVPRFFPNPWKRYK